MLKTQKKEILWLIGMILFLAILFFGPFGFRSFDSTSSFDINIHDTYIVFPSIHLFILVSSLVFFFVYLIRMLLMNFKNLMANIIFMVSDIAMILILTILISFLFSIREISGITEYPPLSSENVDHVENVWNIAFCILLSIQFVLIILLIITGVKTGMNYKTNQD